MRKMLSGVAIVAIATLTIHVTSAGAVATPRRVIPTNTAINGRVNALALGASRLFIGGQMTAPFNRLGAVNPGSGAVVWAASGVSSEVRALDYAGGALFVGGAFGVRIYDASSLALLRSFSCGTVRALAVDSPVAGVRRGEHLELRRTGAQEPGPHRRRLAQRRGRLHGVDQRHGHRPRVRRPAGRSSGGSSATINGTSRFRLGKITSTGAVDTSLAPTYVPASGEPAAGSRSAPSTPAMGACSPHGVRRSTRCRLQPGSGAFVGQWGSTAIRRPCSPRAVTPTSAATGRRSMVWARPTSPASTPAASPGSPL